MSTVTTSPAPEQVEETEGGGGKKKVLLIGVLVVAIAGAAGWWFFLKPAEAAEKPKPGEVVKLEAIQVNLADDHYLRIGLGLQATEGAPVEEIDGSKALDATIELFTGERKEKLAQEAYRHKLKKKLEQTLEEAYDEEVMGVYFTDFVTQ